MKFTHGVIAALILLCFSLRVDAGDHPGYRLIRVPDAGVQPEVAMDEHHVLHLIYLTGDPAHSDINYRTSSDGGDTFGPAMRVNSQQGSAIALGTVRGAHLALGREGTIHVAWPGSMSAQPKGAHNASPMLYTRLRDDGAAFEPQRNVIQSHFGVDGGGSVAADRAGNVYVAWHAPQAWGEKEQSRRVWLARSRDDGSAFDPETAISPDTGVCGCCGMRMFASAAGGDVFVLYRTADRGIHRDMTLLRWQANDHDLKAAVQTVGTMNSAICLMSTCAFAAATNDRTLAAWESQGTIFWTTIDNGKGAGVAQGVVGTAQKKHPTIAADAQGNILVAWTQDTGWNKGGSIAFEILASSDGQPTRSTFISEKTSGLPAWGAPAAFVRPDGKFGILY